MVMAFGIVGAIIVFIIGSVCSEEEFSEKEPKFANSNVTLKLSLSGILSIPKAIT